MSRTDRVRERASSVLARLCAAGGLAYCSYTMCRSPVLPIFARHLGAGAELVGLVVAASTVTGILLKLPAGALSDIVGRRALMIAGALVFAVLPFSYPWVGAVSWLIAIRFVHGSATAVFSPVASATLSDFAPPERRGRWLGTYSAVQGIGQASGAMLAGYLVTGGDFDAAFWTSGGLGVIALLLVMGTRARRSSGAPRESWARAMAGIGAVVTDARLLAASIAQAAQFFVNGSLNAFVPLFAREVLGLSLAQVGIVFGVQTVSTFLARPAFGALSDRVGRRPLVAAGLGVCAAGVAGIALANGFSMLLAAAVLYGTGAAITSSSASAYVTDLAAGNRYGAAHGMFGTIYDLGDAGGPIVAGVLVAAIGYRGMLGIIAALAGLISVAATIWFVGFERRFAPSAAFREASTSAGTAPSR